MIGLLKKAFLTAGLDLYLLPYGVIATGYECGIIEVIPNSKSRAQLVRLVVLRSWGLDASGRPWHLDLGPRAVLSRMPPLFARASSPTVDWLRYLPVSMALPGPSGMKLLDRTSFAPVPGAVVGVCALGFEGLDKMRA